ncbi:hypothetical protein GDO81_024005 [Engystomops pustulosus]|uniref:Uncharacterized protein n=1 Tax=Engystomops pustulosus TaxID=76066 RepID=A0AAV6YR76_ENGPU|nr:hypothetical protein GDO81_024005 [Engystomops pustulosus]
MIRGYPVMVKLPYDVQTFSVHHMGFCGVSPPFPIHNICKVLPASKILIAQYYCFLSSSMNTLLRQVVCAYV